MHPHRDELEHEERLARREDLLSAGSTDAELPAMVLRGETRLTQVSGGSRQSVQPSWSCIAPCALLFEV